SDMASSGSAASPSSPAHALARLDQRRVVGRRSVVVRKISVSCDNHDQECDDREQIDLAGVVTVMADFPAHRYFLPRGHHNNANEASRVPGGQSCTLV